MLTGTSLAANETYDAGAFQQALEQDGFTVQEGELAYFDLIRLLEEGVLPSAYGNNPTTKYVAFFIPAAAGHEIDERISNMTSTLGMSGHTTPFWSLRPDEAIVFVGRTPPRITSYNVCYTKLLRLSLTPRCTILS